jgi:hypothetical protein
MNKVIGPRREMMSILERVAQSGERLAQAAERLAERTLPVAQGAEREAETPRRCQCRDLLS